MAEIDTNVYTAPEVTEEEVAKQRANQEKNYLSPREMAAYIISGIGDKNWETFNGNNEFFYTTSFLHVNPITLSLAQSVCSILDTFDNAISGPILDRTRTRWGRVRPYLVLTLPLFLFSAAMPYLLPDGLSQVSLMALFFFIRYIGSIGNSFYNPAYSAVLYNLTPNTNERNRLIAADTYVDLLGVWLPSLFPFFVDYLPRTIPTRNIYMVGAIIFISLVVVFRVFGFFNLRERVPLASRDEMKSVSVLQSVKQVATCRPMWSLVSKEFCSMGKATGQSVANYFWLNCTGKLSNAAISGLFTGLPSYFVLPFATKWTKKLGLRNLGILAYGYAGIVYLIMFLIGFRPTQSSIVNLIIIVIG
ncbi:MAG: MFS transporter, partial [Oscillospiraceae bacterium]|nr:MFS transporter [Oscillospiraceae bacterium]